MPLPSSDTPAHHRYHGLVTLLAILGLALPAIAARPEVKVPPDFPHFTVPGHEAAMNTLRELHWNHYAAGGPMATLWDEWMSWSTQWQAVGTDNRLEQMRERWRQTLTGRIIDPDGYVATHQHPSIAHQLGWPFPWWSLGGGESWSWFFSLQGVPAAPWNGGATTRPADTWITHGVGNGGVGPDAWNIELTAPLATIQPPPTITIGVHQSPFLQLRWRARGLTRAQPFVEWRRQGQKGFPAAQRMYFEPADSDAVITTMIPVYENPEWNGLIIALRINFGNIAPGAKVGVHSLFNQYDTRHTINNQNFIKGVVQTFWWTHDLTLLRSQINRARIAMRWMMTDLGGLKEKMIVAPFFGRDGRSGVVREADGKKTVRAGYGIGSHYWDILPCGYRDGYATLLYYDAIRALSAMERDIAAHPEWDVPGGALELDPAELDRHADEVKATFQKTFWNPEARRFAIGIDTDGRSYDYGYTFMNFEAVYYDLASPAQARDILDWISGRRVVEGDTSTGADIYHYRFAPRASTLRNLDWYGWYWSNPESLPFGDQVQDGGAVLGFSYHDLMSRLRVSGPDDAWNRLHEILRWSDEVQNEGGYRAYYSKPGRGTMQGGGVAGGLGLDMEFFESLLVPQFVLRGIAGFEPTADGFKVDPKLPKDWPSLTIDHIALHDLQMTLKLAPGLIEVRKEGLLRHDYRMQLPRGPWKIEYFDAANKTLRTASLTADIDSFALDWNDAAGVRLTK